MQCMVGRWGLIGWGVFALGVLLAGCLLANPWRGRGGALLEEGNGGSLQDDIGNLQKDIGEVRKLKLAAASAEHSHLKSSAATEFKRKLAAIAARDHMKEEIRAPVPLGILAKAEQAKKFLHRFGGKGQPAAAWEVAEPLDRWGQEEAHKIRYLRRYQGHTSSLPTWQYAPSDSSWQAAPSEKQFKAILKQTEQLQHTHAKSHVRHTHKPSWLVAPKKSEWQIKTGAHATTTTAPVAFASEVTARQGPLTRAQSYLSRLEQEAVSSSSSLSSFPPSAARTREGSSLNPQASLQSSLTVELEHLNKQLQQNSDTPLARAGNYQQSLHVRAEQLPSQATAAEQLPSQATAENLRSVGPEMAVRGSAREDLRGLSSGSHSRTWARRMERDMRAVEGAEQGLGAQAHRELQPLVQAMEKSYRGAQVLAAAVRRDAKQEREMRRGARDALRLEDEAVHTHARGGDSDLLRDVRRARKAEERVSMLRRQLDAARAGAGRGVEGVHTSRVGANSKDLDTLLGGKGALPGWALQDVHRLDSVATMY